MHAGESPGSKGTGVFMPAWLGEKLVKAKARKGKRGDKVRSREQSSRQHAGAQKPIENASDGVGLRTFVETSADALKSSSAQQAGLQDMPSCTEAASSSAPDAASAPHGSCSQSRASSSGEPFASAAAYATTATTPPAASTPEPSAVTTPGAGSPDATQSSALPEQASLTAKQLQAIQQKYDRHAQLQQESRVGNSFTSVERSAGSFSSSRQPPAPLKLQHGSAEGSSKLQRSSIESSSSTSTWNSSSLAALPVPIMSCSQTRSGSMYSSSALSNSVYSSSAGGSTSATPWFSRSRPGSTQGTISRASTLTSRLSHDFPDLTGSYTWQDSCPASMGSNSNSFSSMHNSSVPHMASDKAAAGATIPEDHDDRQHQTQLQLQQQPPRRLALLRRFSSDSSAAAAAAAADTLPPWLQQQQFPAHPSFSSSRANSSTGGASGLRSSTDAPGRSLSSLPSLREESSIQSKHTAAGEADSCSGDVRPETSASGGCTSGQESGSSAVGSVRSLARLPAGVFRQQSDKSPEIPVGRSPVKPGQTAAAAAASHVPGSSPARPSTASDSSLNAQHIVLDSGRQRPTREGQGAGGKMRGLFSPFEQPAMHARQKVVAQLSLQPHQQQQLQPLASPVNCAVPSVLDPQRGMLSRSLGSSAPTAGSAATAAGSAPAAAAAAATVAEEARLIGSDLAELQVQLQAVQALQMSLAGEQQSPAVQHQRHLQAVQPQQLQAVQPQHLQAIQPQQLQAVQVQTVHAVQGQRQPQAVQEEQLQLTHALQQLRGVKYQQQLQVLHAGQSPDPLQEAQQQQLQDDVYDDYADFAVDDEVFCLSRGVSANNPQGFGVPGALPRVHGSSTTLQQSEVQQAVQQQTLHHLLEQLAIGRRPSSNAVCGGSSNELLHDPVLLGQSPVGAEVMPGSDWALGVLGGSFTQQQQQQRLLVGPQLQQQMMIQPLVRQQQQQQHQLLQQSADSTRVPLAGGASTMHQGHAPFAGSLTVAGIGQSLIGSSHSLTSAGDSLTSSIQYSQYIAGPAADSNSVPVQGNIGSDQLLQVVNNSMSCDVPFQAYQHPQPSMLRSRQSQLLQPPQQALGVSPADSDILTFEQILQMQQSMAPGDIAGSGGSSHAAAACSSELPNAAAAAWQDPGGASRSNSSVLPAFAITPAMPGGAVAADAAQQQAQVLDAQQQVQDKLQQLLQVQQIQAAIQKDLMKLLPLV